MQCPRKITTFLWFDDQAEEAIAHYQSIFGDSPRTTNAARHGAAGLGEPGSFLVGTFEMGGQPFIALNGGPGHPFTTAISLSVDCVDQDEVDYFWEKLSAGGATNVCGWLTDKYGLSWQVVPRRLPELLSDADPAKAARAMAAMMGMTKIDVAALERAAAG